MRLDERIKSIFENAHESKGITKRTSEIILPLHNAKKNMCQH